MQGKGSTNIEMCQFGWRRQYKTISGGKDHKPEVLQTDFFCRITTHGRTIKQEFFNMLNMRKVSRPIENTTCKLFPTSKNTLVSLNEIEEIKKRYAIEDGTSTHPRKAQTSSFKLQNRTLITSLLRFYL